MRTQAADIGPVTAERPVTWHRPVTTHSPGRICSQPECGTRLSIYNSTDRCSLHRMFVTIVPRNPAAGQEADTD